MTTATQPRSESEPINLGDNRWYEWVRAHGRPRQGWVSEWVCLAFADTTPPPQPRPAWLLDDLYPGQGLILRRADERSHIPTYSVHTHSGRDLGRIALVPAAMVGFLIAEGIAPRVSVLGSSSRCAPEDAVQLLIDIEAWFAPGDRMDTPVVLDERAEGM